MIVVKTLAGLEDLLAGELKQLGANNIQILKRAVSCEGDKKLIYRINYECRTALKVLMSKFDFPAASEDELYDNVKKIHWEDLLDVNTTFAIDGVVSNSNLNHSYFAALKTKDAIADYFQEKLGKRPSVDVKEPDLQLNVHINRNHCNISLDSSGDSLHKRGYRQSGGPAPINEVLAAGLIMMSGWKGKTSFLDPFCGSGTLLIEAAKQAMNIPPGYYRKSFAFFKWADFDEGLWKQVKEEADARITETEISIMGSDISDRALLNARRNIQAAQLHKDIVVMHSSFEKLMPPFEKGTIITNPPYGERIQKKDMIDFYKMMGDVFKQKYTGFDAYILAADFYAVKYLGLRSSFRIDVFNGKIPCKFIKFELYEGSKKAKKDTRPS
ncbi:MAG: THUMP domain-containing protein [Bacteroidota bacterium]|nr:THUMP domain-containing protein [Bacteroidota bacterium]